jgi:hypothetical protein
VLHEHPETPVPDAQQVKSPGTVANDSSSGGTKAWTNPGNAKASDNSKATCEFGFPNVTEFLKATNFGFTLPGTATVCGIVAEVERVADGALRFQDHKVQICKAGAPSGENKAKSDAWPTVDTYAAYGASSDFWGLSWTVAEINSSGFGLAIAVAAATSAHIASIDHVRITVYYTGALAEDRVCFATRSVDLGSARVVRQAPDEDVWGETVPDGFFPFDVPGGLEQQPSRGILIPSQGDLGEVPDTGTNRLSAVVKTRRGSRYGRGAS